MNIQEDLKTEEAKIKPFIEKIKINLKTLIRFTDWIKEKIQNYKKSCKKKKEPANFLEYLTNHLFF